MTKILSLAIFLFLFALAAPAQTAPAAAELRTLLDEFLAGAGRNDAAVHDRFWAHDLIYTRSSGVRTNKDELMKGVRSAPPHKDGDPTTVYTAENVVINQYGSTAVVAFTLVGTTNAGEKKTVTNHLNTGTFVKREGKWQVVAWQATAVPQKVPVAASAPNKPGDSAETKRSYQKGPRGGCYFLNASGAKVYVDKKFCP